MKVVQINHSADRGGAANAMVRLNLGLQKLDIDSRICARDGKTSNLVTHFPESERPFEYVSGLIQDRYINQKRTKLSNTIFTFPFPGFNITQLEDVQNADIINLHWINYFLSPPELTRLAKTGKPIVWTIHDEWAYTGGCHYTSGCNLFQQGCHNCPQLFPESHAVPSFVLDSKIREWQDLNMTIVGPSNWICDEASKSLTLGHSNIECIPNSVDTDLFKPGSKKQAKAEFNIPEDTFTILFGAEYGSEKRKGFELLLEALTKVSSDSVLKNKKVHLLLFGEQNQLDKLPFPSTSLGYVTSQEILVNAYCAADLFILPSIEDNLPNTMLESMACGTPILAFKTGGIPDMVNHEENGFIAEQNSGLSLGEELLRILTTPNSCEAAGKRAIETIQSGYTLKHQAEAYSKLYNRLLKDRSDQKAPSSPTTNVALGSGLPKYFHQNKRMLSLANRVLDEAIGIPHNEQNGKSWLHRFFGKKPAKAFQYSLSRNWKVIEESARSKIDSCEVYDPATIALTEGFREFEGPYPQFNLPQIVWGLYPHSDFLIESETAGNFDLICNTQTNEAGAVLQIENDTGVLNRVTLDQNFGNPDMATQQHSMKLPLHKGVNHFRFRYFFDEKKNNQDTAVLFTHIGIHPQQQKREDSK